MSTPTGPIALDGDDNPYQPPPVAIEDRGGGDDPEAEAIRGDHVRLESFVRAVGIIHYGLALIIGSSAVWHTTFAIQHAIGRISAPWITHPFWVAMITLSWIITVAAPIAGLGLRRFRSWAPDLSTLTVLALTIDVGLSTMHDFSRGDYKETALVDLFLGAWLTPIVILLWMDRREVYSPEYRQVIARTPHFKMRARLPRGVKLVMAAFLVALVAVAALF